MYACRVTGITPLLRISPTANPAYRLLAFVRLVNGFFFFSESDWLSQVPTSTVRSPAAASDPGTFQLAHHSANLFSGFSEMKHLAFVQQGTFRGSIPSLTLRLTSSFTPASCRTLPGYMRSSVLNWWLAFVQAGLSSLSMPACPGTLIKFSSFKNQHKSGALCVPYPAMLLTCYLMN